MLVRYLGADDRRGKDNAVKRDVVLGHKLVELHLVGVLPPLLPLLGVVGRDGKVPNGGIKPDVKHLHFRR